MKINEIFLSVQGEGISQGRPTIFVRTSGCNLRCTWCDTKYAYTAGREMPIAQILEKCRKYPVKRVCLTGGEPLLQKKDCLALINHLLREKYEISIEAGGAVSIFGLPTPVFVSLDIKCPASKMSERMRYNNLKYIRSQDQVKFVIADDRDYRFAKKVVAKYKLDQKTNVIFQPVYGTKFTQDLAESILRDGLDVRFGLQLHKVIWGEKRGV